MKFFIPLLKWVALFVLTMMFVSLGAGMMNAPSNLSVVLGIFLIATSLFAFTLTAVDAIVKFFKENDLEN
jgi:hypothetical protein